MEDELIGASTDIDGLFKATNVPVGRLSIEVGNLHYELVVIKCQLHLFYYID